MDLSVCNNDDDNSPNQPIISRKEGEDNSTVKDEETLDDDSSEENNDKSDSSSEIQNEDIPQHTVNPQSIADIAKETKTLKSRILNDQLKSSEDLTSFKQDKNELDDKVSNHRNSKASSKKLVSQPNTKHHFENMLYNKKNFAKTQLDDQPLDLSTKSKSKDSSKDSANYNSKEEGLSSSLKSLQMRFGGNFNIEPPRKPSSIVPLQPTNHLNRVSKQPYNPQTPLQAAHIKSNIKPQFVKKEKSTTSTNISLKFPTKSTGNEEEVYSGDNKYTTHRCSCNKTYASLHALSSHIQDTGHTPVNAKASTLLDYPKLVRGQDMWLNQESEQTRRILRCMQCGESFQSLPMLTVHMMKTQHYTKIVSADHGRRSHKCSAYCEKELERECVFKCKVCHEAFGDMEALANHMVQSGHHKKQVLRAQNYSDLTLRNRRKRFNSDDSANILSNYYDFKRKCLPLPNSLLDDEDIFIPLPHDNSITCENCGKRIEMKYFVDHVRACIRQKSSVIGVLKSKLLNDESNKTLSDSENSCTSPPLSPQRTGKRKIQDTEESAEIKERKTHLSHHLKSRILQAFSPKQKIIEDLNKGNEGKKSADLNEKHNSLCSPPNKSVNGKPETSSNTEEIPIKKEKEIKREIAEDDDKRETTPVKQVPSQVEQESIPSSLTMDILDPNLNTPSSKSALQAMESFIQNSFSTKFDYRRQNCVPVPSTMHRHSLHLSKSESGFKKENNKLSKYKNLYEALHYREVKNGQCKVSSDKNKTIESKKCNNIKKENDNEKVDDNEDVNNECEQSIKDNSSDTDIKPSSSFDHSVLTKYLNIEKETDKEKEEASALNSLSSFVYSQPMTSEHPLDSLQRLLTKTDIPKALSRHFDLPYLTGIPELALPLNLSVKQCLSDDEDIDVGQEGTLSSSEDRASPVSEGEQRDYKCAACSRQFVSKGSYRYHLSRCHLSSVRKYGIKEAFNMSPYIYLPLDHTAKFSKYYEMAYELANKGK
ncbi:hypothetical protein LOTGIDRAFT_155690 [Lottia gigantea]|uniref:C2H2-type domain-containing protein n=1 Tax=Lottia gigantea TaxID=225164 RepID=V3ZJW6_LOTGI|nr:hypothetical protein LOTGIDRAFT_155690 [Lottia gigantea]ESO82675.1 hypothetical protein LOTGIDRAFT_155690 [Lottia gigantea]